MITSDEIKIPIIMRYEDEDGKSLDMPTGTAIVCEEDMREEFEKKINVLLQKVEESNK